MTDRLTREVRELAQEARLHFQRKRRDDGSEFWATDGSSEWMRDLCFAAHDDGDLLPDDYRYEFIVAALDLICESEVGEDVGEIETRIEADIYNSDLLEWVSSATFRPFICDDAVEQLHGCGADISTIDRLSWGQWYERRAVFASVLESLQTLAIEHEIDRLNEVRP